MSIPVYVVPTDQLVDESLLGGRLYNDTIAVVKESDHLAEVERVIQETAHNLNVVYERWREDALADHLAEVERVLTEADMPKSAWEVEVAHRATQAERERIVEIIYASVMLAKPDVVAHVRKLLESIEGSE